MAKRRDDYRSLTFAVVDATRMRLGIVLRELALQKECIVPDGRPYAYADLDSAKALRVKCH